MTGVQGEQAGLLTIGEVARRSGLSVKALRHYDRVRLLCPAAVDGGSGYRLYRSDQVEEAQLVHLLRSLDLPARYISGYLRNDVNLTGAEASHAWVSVWCPVLGWQGFDPTNNTMPGGRHVTLAWGRDYYDVTPVKGVALGGGEHVISVSVDASPAPDS